MSATLFLDEDSSRATSSFIPHGIHCHWCGYKTVTKGDLKRHQRERFHIGPPPKGQHWKAPEKIRVVSPWTPAVLQRAKELSQEGLFFRALQEKLNLEFELTLTKNAVKAKLSKEKRRAS